MKKVRSFAKNEVIFREGTYERCMYSICTGRVKIYVNYETKDAKLLTTLDAGRFFGEIGMAESMPRSATAVAAEDNTTVVTITAENFSEYFQSEPQKLLEIMRNMNDRLRVLTHDYLEAREAVAEAIDNVKKGKKQSEGLLAKLGKLVQNAIKPSFLNADKKFEEASFIKANADQVRVIKVFRKNDVIFREGDDANCLYDIRWGTVGIFANYGTADQELLVELKAEEFFGEMGLLDHLPRTATAVALEDDTKVRLVTEEVFEEFMKEYPAKILMIVMNLSSRLRNLTKEYMEICLLAEKASYTKEESWADYLADDIIEAYSMPYDAWDYYSYCYRR